MICDNITEKVEDLLFSAVRYIGTNNISIYSDRAQVSVIFFNTAFLRDRDSSSLIIRPQLCHHNELPLLPAMGILLVRVNSLSLSVVGLSGYMIGAQRRRLSNDSILTLI